MSHTKVIISPKLKHKVDRYVSYVNIVDSVVFAKISIGSIQLYRNVSCLPRIISYITELFSLDLKKKSVSGIKV